jgi:pimeloyl-ACP methyl ester carboxylesterase
MRDSGKRARSMIAGAQESEEAQASGWKTALWLAGSVAGAVTLLNALPFALSSTPSHAVGGYFDRYPGRHGDIAYAVQGVGSPVLLLHGFGAGNSMAEWAANVEGLARFHTVYTLDFPGWGLSDKPKQRQHAQEYVEVVASFLRDIVRQPCALLASSQACALAVRVAAQEAELVSKLVLVCPSPQRSGAEQMAQQALAKSLLQVPGLSTAFYNAVSSRQSIEKFLREQAFYDGSLVTPALVERYHASAHQNDAPYAVYSFLEGDLDLDSRADWDRLEQPALLVWGRNARLAPLDTAPEWLANKPDARLHVIDKAMLLPHMEHPSQWNEAVNAFLAS